MTTFVLVPGAWLGAWVWGRVSPLLETEGDVFAVTLTGMGERVHLASPEHGIETAIQDVLNVIFYNDLDDIVLVGHSFAGKVVAPVADRAANRVRLVVYVDALRPDRVRTPQASFDPRREFGQGPPGSWSVPFSEKIIDAIGPDVKGDDRKWLLSKATPWPVKPAMEPITLSERFDSIKSAYVFCSKSGDPVDEIVAGKLEGPHKVIDSGHWPMITMPEELADDIISLALG